MYSNDDLDKAVEQGIFSSKDVSRFRDFINKSQNSPSIDEEQFKLITSFNDVFVVVACSLFIISTNWIAYVFINYYSFLLTPIIAWFLANFFVLKRRMAFPGIILSFFFSGGLFTLILTTLIEIKYFNEQVNTLYSIIAALLVSTIGTYFHWRRFKVPITMSILFLSVLGTFFSTILCFWPTFKDHILILLIISGILTFSFAIYWDQRDLTRTSYKSDTAFWLHIASAPLIINPLFTLLGISEEKSGIISMFIVLLLFLFFVVISLIIDRRAFMLSSLIYVVYALSTYFNSYSEGKIGFALSGIIVGLSLVFLSVFWNSVRLKLIKNIPLIFNRFIPNYRE